MHRVFRESCRFAMKQTSSMKTEKIDCETLLPPIINKSKSSLGALSTLSNHSPPPKKKEKQKATVLTRPKRSVPRQH